jgi:hypothetical protein
VERVEPVVEQGVDDPAAPGAALARRALRGDGERHKKSPGPPPLPRHDVQDARQQPPAEEPVHERVAGRQAGVGGELGEARLGADHRQMSAAGRISRGGRRDL